ncbi:hypothetical protein ElyMa_006583800 [Elysia marginata]|uniref:Secreted protein n=1 Tax=Elysia marginata TaxID=1093978 RepID=A0AAV4IHB8_9GAST|nr:hypothetical protein ElyMa_006583800 [Elysia marginata]
MRKYHRPLGCLVMCRLFAGPARRGGTGRGPERGRSLKHRSQLTCLFYPLFLSVQWAAGSSRGNRDTGQPSSIGFLTRTRHALSSG